jgi:carbon storage regulator CsrA
MLILTRKIGEAIKIDGDRITLVIMAARGDEVRLGVQARDERPNVRTEVHAEPNNIKSQGEKGK